MNRLGLLLGALLGLLAFALFALSRLHEPFDPVGNELPKKIQSLDRELAELRKRQKEQGGEIAAIQTQIQGAVEQTQQSLAAAKASVRANAKGGAPGAASSPRVSPETSFA